MSYFDLVIFDCDGVLVDSEKLTQETLVKVLNTECDLCLTLDDMYKMFLGISLSQSMKVVETMKGQKPPSDLEDKCRSSINRALQASITSVEGIHEAINAIYIPCCVASSGSYEKMNITLGKTSLLALFEGNIFSTSDVGRGKPYPDIYWHAANKMGISKPSKCVVIEDSPLGVKGAKAAGMVVFAYTGSVDKKLLIEAGADITFDHMNELAPQINSFYGSDTKNLL